VIEFLELLKGLSGPTYAGLGAASGAFLSWLTTRRKHDVELITATYLATQKQNADLLAGYQAQVAALSAQVRELSERVESVSRELTVTKADLVAAERRAESLEATVARLRAGAD